MVFLWLSLKLSMFLKGKQVLERVAQIRDLGFIMGQKLRITDHVMDQCSNIKAYAMLGFMKRICVELKRIYGKLIRPILEYGSVV